MIVLIIVIVFLIFNHTLYPVFFSLARAESVRISNRAVNEAVNEKVYTLKYEDLITYQTDNNGSIVLMEPNISSINKFTSQISLHIQDNFEAVTNKGVSIPLTQILGLDVLAGMGPFLDVKIVPVGFVHPPKIIDSFQSAGINQTRHKIYIQVDMRVRLIIPFSREVVKVSSEVPVIEVTILGRVPEIYVGLSEDNVSGIINNSTNLP
jgi:sporulation protein YunB